MALSVIIPTLNGAGIIEGQFKALAQQADGTIGEVIIADNGSTDDLAGTVARWQGRLPNLRIIDATAKRGISFARNTAARLARYDAFAFCDCDDEVGPDWAAGMDETLSDHALATGPIDLFSLNPEWVARSRAGTTNEENPMKNAWTAGWMPFGFGANIGTSRRAFEAVSGFDETMLAQEDVDFCWAVQLAGFPLRFDPRILVSYRVNPSLWRTFKKSKFYSEWYVVLCKKYRDRGMPLSAPSWKRLARRWWRTLGPRNPGIRRLGDPAGRAKIAFEAGDHLGLMVGAIRHRLSVY